MLLFISLIVVYVSSTTVFTASEKNFNDWMRLYGKKYSSKLEMISRFKVWSNTIQNINKWNSENTYGTARFAPLQFADLTRDEIRERNGWIRRKPKKSTWVPLVKNGSIVAAPSSIDWRTLGAVTPVKNQGNCGSCWSFCSTGTLEGATAIKTGTLVSLSEQNLIDCSLNNPNCSQCGITCCNNDGCDGGRSDWALDYVVDNGGLDTEASYPYTAQDGTCQYSPSNIGATCKTETTLPQGDEGSLMNQVGNGGPVAVSISVDDAFANYQSGVFTDDSCANGPDDLDHCVLSVGYGTDSSSLEDYWIVKNSWGASWGASGYILMRRNYNNMCGIATDAVYPTV